MVAVFDDPRVLAQDVTFCRHNQSVRIDLKADRAIGEWRRNAVAIALEADQTCGREAFAQLDEAVKGDGQRHQRGLLYDPDIGDRTGQSAMGRLAPQRPAASFQSSI